MNELISYNSGSDIPGVYNYADLALDVNGVIVSGSYGKIWGLDVCEIDHFTFMTNTFTQSRAGGTFEESTPIFYLTPTSSADTLNTINRLPDRVAESPFSFYTDAIQWVSGSEKYITLLDCDVFDYNEYLLQEDLSFLLQEDGSKIKLY
jgi:hypothetical protein